MPASVAAIWTNLSLWIPVSAAIGVQLYKFIAQWVRAGTLDFHVLFSTGGMPSSHSAMVVSLATAIGIDHGFGSPFFAISTILALVVMYDARGVRQESGQHARLLNHIVRELFAGNPIGEEEYKELKVLLGHTAAEVAVGAIIGVVYPIAVLALVHR